MDTISRRKFLEASAAGAAVLASGSLFTVAGAETKALKIFVCSICGHVEFGEAPERCPVCGASKEKFEQNDNVFSDMEVKFKDKTAGHVPDVMVNKSPKLITEVPTKEIHVRIGKTLHPMEETHYIQWIDCYIDDKYVSRIRFTATGLLPATAFHPKVAGAKTRIIEHCNLHGHWQAEAML